MTAVIISNEEMDDIMKIVKSLEKSGLLIKGVSKKKKKSSRRTKWLISQNVIIYIKC